MDPQTAYASVTLIMMINGGALGLLHRELPANLRGPALYWLAGTLLIAIGGLSYAMEDRLPLPLMVGLANGSILLGVTAYWHSLRRFHGQPGSSLILLPGILSLPPLLWFSTHTPDTGARILIAGLAWMAVLLGSLRTLRQQRKRGYSRSHQVLTAIYLTLLVLIILRTLYLLFIADIAPDHSIVSRSWMNLLTPMVAALLPVAGTTVFILMCHEHLRRQWEQAASTDFLTGLANRRSLSGIAKQRLGDRRRGGTGLAIALIDIDHFKQINDLHGHEAGDQALRHVARLLQDHSRSNELAVRLGGEEFLMLLELDDPDQARQAGERLREIIETHPFRLGELQIPMTVSIGIALYRNSDQHFDTLLKRADQGVYAAKKQGRNRVVVVTEHQD